MTEESMEELRAILPGTGQPDPAFLLELAPLIPAYLLPRAIQVALGISYPALRLRACAVESLAGRLKPEDEALLEETLTVARTVFLTTGEQEPALLLTLAPLLPPHLIPQALELAIRIVNYDTRIDVLATLATRLSPADQEAILSTALDAVLTLEFEGNKASALIMLIRHLPSSLLEKTLTVAKSLQDKESRAEALTALGKSLRGKKRLATLTETLALIRSMRNRQARALALEEVAPILSRELMAEALEMARGMSKTSERVHAMAALAAYLPRAEKPAILSEVLGYASKMRRKDTRASALAELAPLLPRRERRAVLEQIVKYVREIRQEVEKNRPPPGLVYLGEEPWDSWKHAQARASGLGKLASRLPEEERLPLLAEAVADAVSIGEAWSRASVLTGLAPVLPESLLREARERERRARAKEDKALLESEVRELPEYPDNIEYLVSRVQQLPGEERSTLISKAFERARLIREKNWQARALIALASLLPAEQRSGLIAEVLNLISSIESPEDRAELSSELVPLLPESQREQVLPGILDVVRTAKDESYKATILDALIPVVPVTSMRDVMEIIDSFKNQRFRVEALEKMAVYLPPSALRRPLTEALAGIASVQDAYERAYLLEGLAPYLVRPLLMQALNIARRIRRRDFRANAVSAALASLARQAWGMEREEILREALKEAFFTSRPGGGKGGRSDPVGIYVQGERARELLMALPEARKESLLQEWLGPVEKVPGEDFRESMKMAKPPSPPAEEEEGKEMAEAPRPAQERVVNTGFSDREQADRSLDKGMPLASGGRYYFWLEVGELDRYSIEKIPTPIPVEHLPSEALLKVVLFGFEDGIKVTPGADVGELKLLPDGTAEVNKQPVQQTDSLPSDLAVRRLFFPVTAPARPGISRLRCNIYYEQILVQARLIQALVMEQPQPVSDALSSVVDYTLSHTLWPAHLNRLDSHRLSLMLNTNGDKTHALIFGQKGDTLFKNEAVLSAGELKTPIDNARQAMWKVSWGDPNPWSGQQYKYGDQKLDTNRLSEDIVSLAIRGYILYNALIDKLTGGRQESYQLADLMLSPGLVQIALKQSPTQVLPAALFYDYPLDTQASQHKLCEAFISSLQNKEPLEKTPCFNGACPGYGKLDHVCPSGFWGYRHFLGTPVSLGDRKDGKDVPPEIVVKGKTEIVAGVATNLDRLDEHMRKLQALRSNLGWYYSEKREEIINLLKTTKAHIIYFYCHGVLGANKALYLQVGNGAEYIEGSNLRANRILWDNPRPLVFINGCHTTAVDPEQAINLVQDFVGSGGAGVVGTEITVFEPLACSFAEECLRLFLSGGSSIGEAVRSARLKLLKEGNPLGLVYTPFVIPSLRMKT